MRADWRSDYWTRQRSDWCAPMHSNNWLTLWWLNISAPELDFPITQSHFNHWCWRYSTLNFAERRWRDAICVGFHRRWQWRWRKTTKTRQRNSDCRNSTSNVVYSDDPIRKRLAWTWNASGPNCNCGVTSSGTSTLSEVGRSLERWSGLAATVATASTGGFTAQLTNITRYATTRVNNACPIGGTRRRVQSSRNDDHAKAASQVRGLW